MSTARHQLAGAPGTGTTIDNMGSRVKSWATINNPAVTLQVLGSFNTSSCTDAGVGNFGHYYTAAFNGTGYGRFTTNSASATINGWSQFDQAGMYPGASVWRAVYWNGTAPAVWDPALQFFEAMGDLA